MLFLSLWPVFATCGKDRQKGPIPNNPLDNISYLFYIEHQAFQVLTFGMVNVDRMISWLCQLMQDANTSTRLCGRTEHGEAEMLFVDHLRAGEGKQDATRLDLLESNRIQFTITLQGIPQYSLMLGESGRIEDD